VVGQPHRLRGGGHTTTKLGQEPVGLSLRGQPRERVRVEYGRATLRTILG